MSKKPIVITELKRLSESRLAMAPLSNLVASDLTIGADRLDQLARPLRDLRVSVTDRCNFRCRYCMPKEVFDARHSFLPQSDLLNFEEITRLARLFAAAGGQKLRLTGGEPLLRKGLEHLVAMLAALRRADGLPLELTLTTNGSLLEHKAVALKAAGLRRITVSLDAIDDDVFRAMNDVDFAVMNVLRGIDAALACGFSPIKVNMVVKKGTNEGQIVPLTRALQQRYGSAVILRFIEYMDVGSTNGWCLKEVFTAQEILSQLQNLGALAPLVPTTVGETAQRWRFVDSGFEIGVIASVTQAFCNNCTRARLSTDGKMFLCLFASNGYDLRALLRGGAGDADISAAIDHLWQGRTDRYSALRSITSSNTPFKTLGANPDTGNAGTAPRVEMHYIGG